MLNKFFLHHGVTPEILWMLVRGKHGKISILLSMSKSYAEQYISDMQSEGFKTLIAILDHCAVLDQ